ncbi:MAG: leucine-rich repeat protein [Clostridia bacterium]|nr:leucine-rich repeat protein [Clostridia bacterium]
MKRVISLLLAVSILFSFAVYFGQSAASAARAYTCVDGSAFTVGTKKVTVLVTGWPNCCYARNTLNAIAKSGVADNQDVAFAFVDVAMNSRESVAEFADQINCSAIKFCYDLTENARNSVIQYTGKYGSPLILYLDSAGKLVKYIPAEQNFASIINYIHAVDETVLPAIEQTDASGNSLSVNDYAKTMENAGLPVSSLENIVRTAVSQQKTRVSLTAYKLKNTTEITTALFDYIFYYMPDVSALAGFSYYYRNGYITEIAISYNSGYEVNSTLAQFQEVSAKLLRGVLNNSNLSDAEKALLIHDRLASYAKYDQGKYFGCGNDPDSYTLYGPFIKRVSVCQGFALAYAYLMNQAGVKTYYVRSVALNHAWNVTYIDGVPYYVDVTWDNPTFALDGYVGHNNFLRSKAGMIETGHISDTNTIDYPISVNSQAINNTKYDKYYWQDSYAEFQLVDDTLYYIDNNKGTLNVADENHTVLFTIPDSWSSTEKESASTAGSSAVETAQEETTVVCAALEKEEREKDAELLEENGESQAQTQADTPAEQTGVQEVVAVQEERSEASNVEHPYSWSNCSRLSSRNHLLLFSGSDWVYQYDLNTNKVTIPFIPDKSKNANVEDYYSIFGFKYEDDNLYCYLYYSAFFREGNKEDYLIKSHFAPADHRHSYTQTVIQSASCLQGGKKNYHCSVCGDQQLELLPALGHDFVNNTCSRCAGKEYEYEIENGGAVIVAYNGSNSTLSIPNKLGGYPVTQIGESAFKDNNIIREVHLPDSVVTIQRWAFEFCHALEEISFPKKLTMIGEYAFSYTALREALIPDSVKTVAFGAFYNCDNLKKVFIGSGVTRLDNYVFASCKSLVSMTVSAQNQMYDSRNGCNAIIYTAYNILRSGCSATTIPINIETIEWASFYGCPIKSVVIPSTVTEIESYAFAYSDLESLTYLGTQANWEKVKVGENNGPLTSAQITYKPCNTHSYNNGVITTQPTCTKKGTKTFSCTVCGATKTQAVAATGTHTFVNGYCKHCDYQDAQYKVPTVSDTFKETVNMYNGRAYYAKFVASKTGVIHFYSTESFYPTAGIYDSDMNCLNKVYWNDNSSDFSLKHYVEKGKEYIISASIYGENATGEMCLTLEYEKSAHAHDFKTDCIVEPTCASAGKTRYTCKVCQYTYEEYSATTSHTYIGGTCIYCQKKDIAYKMPVVTLPLNESVKVYGRNNMYYAKYTPQKDGTITFYSQGDVDPAGYIYDGDMNLLAENDDIFYKSGAENNNLNFKINYKLKAGKTYILACNSYYEELLEVLIKAEFEEHTHAYTAVVTPPTCTEKGFTTHTCSCGEVKVDTYVDARGHKFAAGEQYCQNGCGAKNSDYKPVHVHAYIAKAVKPSETALGYTQYQCSCGAWKKDAAGKAVRDTFSAPTGKQVLKCKARNVTAQTVTWNNVKTATGYQVQISNAAGNKWETTVNCKADVTAYTFKSLAAGSAYKFRMRFYIKAADGKNYFSPWSATLNSPTLPAGTVFTKLTPAKRAFVAQWKKAAVSGYQVQYSLKANFAGAKTITVKNPKLLKATASKLYAGKYYFVRIRTYKTIAKSNYFSAWSKTYKLKTK